MSRPLTPGWALGAPIAFSRDQLDALASHALDTPTFPPHTRLGLIQHLQPPPHQPSTTPLPDLSPGFIALVPDLTALDVLHLTHLHAGGVLLSGDATRHALVVARAAGLPVHKITPSLTTKITQNSTQTLHISSNGRMNPGTLRTCPPGFTPILPPSIVSGAATPKLQTPKAQKPRPWLELVTGQAEERHLARRLLNQGLAQGIGLLRLEFVMYATPDLDADGLGEILHDILIDFIDIEVYIRLADWSNDKPPIPGELGGWNGQRGLDGLTERAFRLQRDALLYAETASCHPRLRIIAPHVGDPSRVAELSAQIGAAQCVAMIESPEAVEQMEALRPHVGGFWVGLGDLVGYLGDTKALDEVLEDIRRLGEGKRLAACGCVDLGD